MYVLTSPIGKQPVGTHLDLTEEQAQHPLYRHRARKMDEPVADTPKQDKKATPIKAPATGA